MKKFTITFTLMALALAGMGIMGCEQKSEQAASRSPNANQPTAAALPANLFVQSLPDGARSVAEIKADADATGEVLVRGRIGGRVEPFVDGAAVFLLADASMKSCDELHGDSCLTPWDYCCEPRESLVAKTATVQVVGADGKPLRRSLKGQHGLAPLASITVAGEIAQRDGSGILVINAHRIHVKPGKP